MPDISRVVENKILHVEKKHLLRNKHNYCSIKPSGNATTTSF